MKRPRHVPRDIWYRDMVGRYGDRIWFWYRCHIIRKHVLKMSTYPNCIWCGKEVRR